MNNVLPHDSLFVLYSWSLSRFIFYRQLVTSTMNFINLNWITKVVFIVLKYTLLISTLFVVISYITINEQRLSLKNHFKARIDSFLLESMDQYQCRLVVVGYNVFLFRISFVVNKNIQLVNNNVYYYCCCVVVYVSLLFKWCYFEFFWRYVRCCNTLEQKQCRSECFFSFSYVYVS